VGRTLLAGARIAWVLDGATAVPADGDTPGATGASRDHRGHDGSLTSVSAGQRVAVSTCGRSVPPVTPLPRAPRNDPVTRLPRAPSRRVVDGPVPLPF
jgi:hypothetical protein